MTLSSYHQQYSNLSDEEIAKRAQVKDGELKIIFRETTFKTAIEPIKVAVLGCGDKRFVKAHKKMFETILNKPVELSTLDISTEHLAGEEGVIKHDCNQHLPNAPYHITYAHVLLKFIPTKQQWNIIRNSYQALITGGLAIHILDKEDYETKTPQLADGYYSVPLKAWKNRIKQARIDFKEIPLPFGLAIVLIK
jgi:hypothetical protein